ncbi:MAG TPA: hypothetical protein PKA58_04790 [Polyangium sp.]|nr:hypothetical protein [Polyangium sp.]
MSCTYLLVRSRRGAADARRRIELAGKYLPIVPETESVHALDENTVCAAFSTSVESAGGSYTHVSEKTGFVVYNGWVAGVKPSTALDSAPIADRIASSLQEKPFETFVEDTSGEWSVLWANAAGELRAAMDFLGGEHIYYAAKDGVVVISNRAILCALALHESIPRPNPWFLGWLLTRTQAFISDDETPFPDVFALHPRTTLHVPAGAYTCDVKSRASRKEFPVLGWDELADEFMERARVIERLPGVSFRLSLTGGLDSRLVLAGLIGARCTQKLRGCYLIAEPTHPDVVVGKMLAAQHGLSFECMPRNAAQIDLWDDLEQHHFQTEMGVQYWDSKGLASRPREGRMGGLYGEIFRSHLFYRQHLGWLGVKWIFEDTAAIDPNDVMTIQGRAHYRDRSRSYWQTRRDEGVTALQMRDCWHRDARIWRWMGQTRLGAALGVVNTNPIPSARLLDKYLSLPVRDQQLARVHYELMRRCAPGLAEQPYATKGFSMLLTGHREKRMTFPQHTRPPLPQRILWQKYRKEIDAYLLAPATHSFFEIVDREKLERRLRTMAPAGNPKEINVVLGLLGVRHAMQEPMKARPCRVET